METSSESEQLARSYATWRRISVYVLGGFSLLLVALSAVVSFFTGNRADFYGGLFYAVFPLITLGYINLILLNPWRDLSKTQKRLEVLSRKQSKNNATTAIWNGWLMVGVSPLFLIGFVGKGAEEGVWQAIAGGLLALLLGGVGVYFIQWGRRSRRAQPMAAQPDDDA